MAVKLKSSQAGQLIVGCSLGLYFTPEVSRQLLDFGGYIVMAALLGILAGALGSQILRRVSGIDPTTAFFSSVPGGAAEMAILAERAGARFDQVVLCHSLRVLLVVSTVPIAVTMTGASGSSTSTREAAMSFSSNTMRPVGPDTVPMLGDNPACITRNATRVCTGSMA